MKIVLPVVLLLAATLGVASKVASHSCYLRCSLSQIYLLSQPSKGSREAESSKAPKSKTRTTATEDTPKPQSPKKKKKSTTNSKKNTKKGSSKAKKAKKKVVVQRDRLLHQRDVPLGVHLPRISVEQIDGGDPAFDVYRDRIQPFILTVRRSHMPSSVPNLYVLNAQRAPWMDGKCWMSGQKTGRLFSPRCALFAVAGRGGECIYIWSYSGLATDVARLGDGLLPSQHAHPRPLEPMADAAPEGRQGGTPRRGSYSPALSPCSQYHCCVENHRSLIIKCHSPVDDRARGATAGARERVSVRPHRNGGSLPAPSAHPEVRRSPRSSTWKSGGLSESNNVEYKHKTTFQDVAAA